MNLHPSVFPTDPDSHQQETDFTELLLAFLSPTFVASSVLLSKRILGRLLSLARESFLGRLIVKCGLAGCVSKSFIGQKQEEEEEEGKPKGCKGSRPASSLSSVTASTFLRFSLFRRESSVWLFSPHPATPWLWWGVATFYL